MIFTSLTFLGFFLSLLAVLWIVKNTRYREIILLLSSYIFYAAWNPVFIILIISSSLWSWYLGLYMVKAPNMRLKKFYFFCSVFLSLSMLGFYKYANFFAENISTLLGISWENADIILPVGISFFTFQTMSYTIDLYRGNIPVCLSLRKFMLFVAFFPQLVAGPIVRASDFLPQLERRIELKWHNLIIGSQLFLGGAIQKVLIADNLSIFVDPIFLEPSLFTSASLLLAVAAYSIQIFCDFSGYSLMAIGLARILGFSLPKNFNMPYIATSITEFWHRWHISLSTWLRDYLYISLGGNRKGELHSYANIFITMLLGGLWHGANWNFVIWGGLHGLALIIHKLWDKHSSALNGIKKTLYYKLIAWSLTMFIIGLLWIPFRCQNYETTMEFYHKLFIGGEGIVWLHPYIIIILSATLIWHILFINKAKLLLHFPSRKIINSYPAFIIGFCLLLIALFAPLNTSPFIYFQF